MNTTTTAQNQIKNHCYPLTATKHDLSKIRFKCRTGLYSTGQLSNRAKRWYWFFAEVVLQGYDTICAPMAAITQEQYHAFGQTKSISTARRAISELEKSGFIRRRQFRRGSTTTIDINRDMFDWYIRKYQNYTDPPQSIYAHTQLHQSDCDPYVFTNDSMSLDTCSCIDSDSNKHAKTTKKTVTSYMLALVYSIGMVCWPRGKFYRETMQTACEAAMIAKVEPFDYWTDERFRSYSIAGRERIARELLPELEHYAQRQKFESKSQEKTPVLEAKKAPTEKNKSSFAAHPPPPPPPELEPENLSPFFRDFANRMGLEVTESHEGDKKNAT